MRVYLSFVLVLARLNSEKKITHAFFSFEPILLVSIYQYIINMSVYNNIEIYIKRISTFGATPGHPNPLPLPTRRSEEVHIHIRAFFPRNVGQQRKKKIGLLRRT